MRKTHMSFTGQNPRFRSTILTDVGLASIGNPASGSHRIINRGGTLQVQDSTGLETAIGAGGTVDRINQTAHGFSVGEALYHTGSAYARGLANAANTSEIVGLVSRVIDANTFELTLEGKVTGLSGLTAGEVYFLSPTVSGGITITEPTVLGHVSLPIGVAISSTVFYVKSSRGAVVGSTNARTEIALANNAVTNVQSVAAYQAGELTGWIEIDGTTDSKFYVAAPFARNGAGTDFNMSPQYIGDTPPLGFSLTVTSGGLIQATLPSIAGYVSAKINFALNAPAVGATFPLSIESTLIQFSTIKAKDSSGFIFQENDGTQIGSINDSGQFVFGKTTGAVNHRAYGTLELFESLSTGGGTIGSVNANAVYNGILIANNVVQGSFTTAQNNASLPSWGIDIGGRETAAYGSQDSINFVRRPAGSSSVSVLARLTNAGQIIANSININNTGSTNFTWQSFVPSTQQFGGAGTVTGLTETGSYVVIGKTVIIEYTASFNVNTANVNIRWFEPVNRKRVLTKVGTQSGAVFGTIIAEDFAAANNQVRFATAFTPGAYTVFFRYTYEAD